MPKREPSLTQFAAGAALMLAAFMLYRVGIFNYVGRLLVDHATTSMHQELTRQKQAKAGND